MNNLASKTKHAVVYIFAPKRLYKYVTDYAGELERHTMICVCVVLELGLGLDLVRRRLWLALEERGPPQDNPLSRQSMFRNLIKF